MRRSSLYLALILACTPKPSDDDSGASSGDAATTGGTMGMSSATEPAPTDGSAEASATSTGGGGIDEACAAFCALYDTCDPQPPGVCLEDCINDELRAGCEDLGAEWYFCLAGLTCADLEFEDNACGALLDQLDAMNCFKICTGSAGPGETMCELEESCPDEPTRRTECTPDGCTCFIDDVATKMCPEAMCDGSGLPSVDCCEGV